MPRNTPDRKVQRFRKGQKTLPERQMNALVDGVNRALIGVNAPVQPKPRGKSGGSPIVVLTLVSHHGDYLTCEDADLNEVLIAKPYELRRTPFDGQTIGGVTYTYISDSEREADGGGSAGGIETQFITPNYRADAEIYAVRVQGDTGVPAPDSSGTNLVYLEIDQGRAWAYDPEA